MRTTVLRIQCLLLLALLMAACTQVQAIPGEQFPTYQPYLGRALSYLTRQIDETGLLRAAPTAAAPQHWLAPDNLLALWAFDTARAGEAAAKLRTALADYAPLQSGLMEAVHGEPVPWPPHTVVAREVQPGVWVAAATGSDIAADWEKHSDLLLIGALNAWNAQDSTEAQRLYSQAMAGFDGNGLPHAGGATGAYATSDLALAIFTGATIGAPLPRALVDALLAKQAPTGGFYAEYTTAGPAGATSTEATAYAALALMAARQEE